MMFFSQLVLTFFLYSLNFRYAQAIEYFIERQADTSYDFNVGSMTLYSYQGEISFELKDRHFETSSAEYVNGDMKDIGKIVKLDLLYTSYDRKYTTVTVFVPSHGSSYVFKPIRTWLRRRQFFSRPTIEAVSVLSYYVVVKTSVQSGAGTDANVYLMIIGSAGKAGPFDLRDEKDSNPFDQGGINRFDLKGQDVGEIQGIMIRHDNTGSGASWYPDTITIVPPNKFRYVFTPERWVEHDVSEVKVDKPSTVISFCPSGWSEKFNQCYKFVDEQLSAIGAGRKCSSLYNSVIAPTKNQQELDFVTSLSNGKEVFIGASDRRIEGKYNWFDGTKMSWTNWASGQPSNDVGYDCVVAKADKSWSSLQCENQKYPFVCMTNICIFDCNNQVKFSTDGYFINTIVPVKTEAECKAKCSASTGCTNGEFFYDECHLFFYLTTKTTSSVDDCKEFCDITPGCKAFRHSRTVCTLYTKPFDGFIAEEDIAVSACVDSNNLHCRYTDKTHL